VYDDHDFRFNDSNGHFPLKDRTKNLFLDFLSFPKNSELRLENRGIYTTYSFGDVNSHKTVRYILLDTRYYKTSNLIENPDILGEEQWTWLENVLQAASETFIFICSGTQILPHDRFITEAWFSNSRKRLFQLIGKYRKSGIILLTGDIHSSQILKTFCVMSNIGYDIYEITSSGLTHYNLYGAEILFDYILPNRYEILPTINDINFGKVEFNWNNDKMDSSIFISIIDYNKVIRSGLNIYYKDLVYNKEKVKKSDVHCFFKVISRFKTFNDYFYYYTEDYIRLGALALYALLLYFIYNLSKLIIRLSIFFIDYFRNILFILMILLIFSYRENLK